MSPQPRSGIFEFLVDFLEALEVAIRPTPDTHHALLLDRSTDKILLRLHINKNGVLYPLVIGEPSDLMQSVPDLVKQISGMVTWLEQGYLTQAYLASTQKEN